MGIAMTEAKAMIASVAPSPVRVIKALLKAYDIADPLPWSQIAGPLAVAFPSQFQFEPLKGTATSCVPFLISCSSAQGYDLVALSTQSPAALVRFTRNRSRRR
ncbi:MAG: hypothetical protein EKK36_08205 [Bradyrhizobiaceae bacterium]|nr:MAG: hypothetical protein EKK36_08205 [Bradyrhizobiaceae bacterium]